MFKIAYLVVYAQFAFIVLLLSALTAEYQANPYMQQWVSDHAFPLSYFLNGYLAAMLIGVVFGGAVLLVRDYLQTRNTVLKR
jgi:hypothetical protein